MRDRPETMEVFIMQAIATLSGTFSRRRSLSSFAGVSSLEAFALASMGWAAPRGASGISEVAAETIWRRWVTATAMCL